MRIIGISAFYHDSAAALLVDGQIVAAAQEERFTRKKHESRFPHHALAYCLDEGEVTLGDVDYVAFYDKPFLKFERLIETYLTFAPWGFRSFRMAIPLWLKEKLFQKQLLRDELRTLDPDFDWEGKLLFTEHHQSHAASAFFLSSFDEAVILTMDGVGEWATTSVGFGRGNHLEMRKELHFPHSLGLLYSAFTATRVLPGPVPPSPDWMKAAEANLRFFIWRRGLLCLASGQARRTWHRHRVSPIGFHYHRADITFREGQLIPWAHPPAIRRAR